MAKTTRHGGDSYTARELNDPDAPTRVRRAELGVVDRPSAGTDYSVSSEETLRENESQTQPLQSPAPTTGNPSEVQDTERDSTAPLMDGVGLNKETQPSTKRTPAKKTARARVRSTDDDEFDTF